MKHIYSGKVRDIYEVDDEHLLFVTSDRISAFDVVMDRADPGQGQGAHRPHRLLGRSAVRRRPHPPGRAWACPPRRRTSRRRGSTPASPRAVPWWCAGPRCCRSSASCAATFRARRGPSTSARAPCTARPCPPACPVPTAARTRFHPLDQGHRGPRREHLFRRCRPPGGRQTGFGGTGDLPRGLPPGRRAGRGERGIIIADTKFELGLIDGELAICDEVLTPDSSRFWPADQWQPGRAPPSFDKQPLRDWLEATGWGKLPPAAGPTARRRGGHPWPLHGGLRTLERAQLCRLARDR